MNLHRYYFQSKSFYVRPIAFFPELSKGGISLVGVEYLIDQNMIDVVVNFGEIDPSFFRRNNNIYYLYKKIGGAEIWIKRNH